MSPFLGRKSHFREKEQVSVSRYVSRGGTVVWGPFRQGPVLGRAISRVTSHTDMPLVPQGRLGLGPVAGMGCTSHRAGGGALGMSGCRPPLRLPVADIHWAPLGALGQGQLHGR